MANQPTVATLVERMEWLQKVGWRIAAIYAAIFCGFVGGFITWYLPRELDRQKADIARDFRHDFDELSKLQLDKLSAQLSSARRSGALVDLHDIKNLGTDVMAFTDSTNSAVSQRAWRTINDVASYYSFASPVDPAFVEQLEKHGATVRGATIDANCLIAPGTTGLVIQGIIIENCTLHLNDLAERNILINFALFRQVRVIYEKGHVSFDRVAFIDCTFQIAFNPAGRRMGQTLLASNDVRNFDFQ